MIHNKNGNGGPSWAPSTEIFSDGIPSGRGGKEAGEQTLGELLSFLARRWRTIALTVMSMLVAGTLYCAATKPKYTAAATLEFRNSPSDIPGERPAYNLPDAVREEKYLQTQVAKLSRLNVANYVLTSRGLADRVKQEIGEPGLVGRFLDRVRALLRPRGEPSSAGPYNFSERFLRKYLSLVKSNPVFSTSLVEVSATTRNPELSRDIVNGQIDGFIEFDRSERHGQILNTLSFLQEQADDLREKVAAAERALAQYAQEKELLSLSDQESVVIREISDLTRLLSDATAARIKSETLLQGVANSPIESSTALDDQTIRAQRVELKQAEAQYAELSKRAGGEYPPLKELQARIQALKGNIREQRRQALTALSIKNQGNLDAERSLRNQVAERKQAAFRDSRDLVRYNIMQREYQSLNDLYQAILRQLKESQVGSASKGGNIAVADYAVTPERPSSPNIPLVMAVSVAAGILLGCAIVASRSLFNQTVESPDEVAQQLQLPMLGVVPLFSLDSRAELKTIGRKQFLRRLLLPGASEGGQAAREDGKSLDRKFPTILMSDAGVSEAFRAIRTTVLLSASEDHPRVILVASPQPGEGKTTLVSNLAVTLAQAGYRTLLLDADLRRGELRTHFHLPLQQAGLADYLQETATMERIIVSTEIDGLDVIPAGTPATTPSELIGMPRMRDLIARLRGNYDYILLDSSPILPVADALVLSTLADGVVLVVRSAVTDRRQAARAMERLRQVRARFLGVVMNALDTERTREYGTYEELGEEFRWS